jgi:iron complex outermembrane receptor protein
MNKALLMLLVAFIFAAQEFTFSQEVKKAVAEMTKEELSQLSYQDLLNLPLEDLMIVANKFGLSSDEILEYFLNKDITSASKRSEKSLNSPLSTTVLSREEITKSGVNSIPEALRLIPGIIVREKTPGNFDVHIRGNDNLPPNNMFLYTEDAMSLVMIDGRPVYNYSFGGTFWETLPIGLNDIERIEVIRGASSALYGPNAVLGTINIITRTVKDKSVKADFTGQIGNQSSRAFNGSVSLGIGNKVKVRLSGNYDHYDRFQNDYYVFGNGKRYTYDQLDTALQYWDGARSKLPVMSDLKDHILDPDLGTNKYGANMFVFYDINKDVNLSLSAGMQSSEVQSSPMGNVEIPFADRVSDSKYVDLRANVYGFQAQVNHMYGDQDIERNNLGWYISPSITNASLEYEKSIGTLVLRPGIGYQTTTYTDNKHMTEEEQANQLGFLNGSPELNAFSFYLRADYRPVEKLRTIAAIRGDKYNVPDKTYFTYQFITSYDLNEKNVVRAVYSRANRGPFIVDSYANYNWPVVPQNNDGMIPYTMEWRGNKNLKMPVIDMFELGYRFQPIKTMMVDLEAFYNYTRDINYFLPDSMSMFVDFLTPSKVTRSTGHVQYYDMEITSKQMGITANVSIALRKNLTLKVYATYQKTTLDNVYPKSLWDNIDQLKVLIPPQITADGTLLTIAQGAMAANAKLQAGVTPTAQEMSMLQAYAGFSNEQLSRLGTLQAAGLKMTYKSSNPDIQNGAIADSLLVSNQSNQATPDLYGGFAIDFSPFKKVDIYLSSYFYSKHSIVMNRKEYTVSQGYWRGFDIDPKFLLNLKVSYKVWKENSVFFNARNLLNNSRHEFAYADKIKGTYMVGMNFNF